MGIVTLRGVHFWPSSRGQGDLQKQIISPGQTDKSGYVLDGVRRVSEDIQSHGVLIIETKSLCSD